MGRPPHTQGTAGQHVWIMEQKERYMNRVLEGDGVNHEGLRLILTAMARHGRTVGQCYDWT